MLYRAILGWLGLWGCLALVGACDSADSAQSTTASTEAAPTTVANPVTTTTLAPDEAHVLAGEWVVTYVLETASENFSTSMDPGDRDVRMVTISPDCELGPCPVDMEFVIPYEEQSRFAFTAQWTDGAYEIVEETSAVGLCVTEDGAEFQDGLDLKTTLDLVPSEYTREGPAWRVTALEGRRIQEWTPNQEAAAGGCEASTVEFVVTGAPRDPNQFSIPSSDPLPSSSLVFRDRGSEGGGLTVVYPEGSTESFVNPVSRNYTMSADGASVIYESALGLRITALDGSNSYEFLPDARVSPSSELAWSSDGSRVAFVRANRDGGSDVWFAYVPFGVPEQVTTGGAALGGVTWGRGDELLLFDWGTNEVDETTQPATYYFSSAIYGYDFTSDEIVTIVDNGARPRVTGAADMMTYLVPRYHSTNGIPITWSVMVGGADGSGAREAFVEFFGWTEAPGGISVPAGVPISPDGARLAFTTVEDCSDCNVPTELHLERGLYTWHLSEGAELISSTGAEPRWTP